MKMEFVCIEDLVPKDHIGNVNKCAVEIYPKFLKLF